MGGGGGKSVHGGWRQGARKEATQGNWAGLGVQEGAGFGPAAAPWGQEPSSPQALPL